MDKKKKILISLIILDIIIIGIAVVLTINLIKTNKEEEKIQNKIENKIENIEANNVIENNVVNKTENNVVENKVQENNTHTHEEEPIADPEQEVDMSTIQKQESNQEKAINIAKESWGEDGSVEFTFDHIDENGRYVIFVRDLATTRQIDEYTIDVETGKVIK